MTESACAEERATTATATAATTAARGRSGASVSGEM